MKGRRKSIPVSVRPAPRYHSYFRKSTETGRLQFRRSLHSCPPVRNNWARHRRGWPRPCRTTRARSGSGCRSTRGKCCSTRPRRTSCCSPLKRAPIVSTRSLRCTPLLRWTIRTNRILQRIFADLPKIGCCRICPCTATGSNGTHMTGIDGRPAKVKKSRLKFEAQT